MKKKGKWVEDGKVWFPRLRRYIGYEEWKKMCRKLGEDRIKK